MTRSAFAFVLVASISTAVACSTETPASVPEPSTEVVETSDPATLSPATSAEGRIRYWENVCLVPRERLEELENRLGMQFQGQPVSPDGLAFWSPDGTSVTFSQNDDANVRIPCDSELRARIESVL